MGTVEQHLLSAEQRWQEGSAAQGKALEDVNRQLPRCAFLGKGGVMAYQFVMNESERAHVMDAH